MTSVNYCTAICELCKKETDCKLIRWFGADKFHFMCLKCIDKIWHIDWKEHDF